MKKYAKKLVLVISVSSLMVINIASAGESVQGHVNFVGTIGEYLEGGNFQSQFRFRVYDSICGSDKQPKERWIVVRSGRVDDKYQHNAVNFKNAYTTLMTAFISGKKVQTDSVSSCDSGKVQTINVWQSQIGIIH